MDYYFFYGTAIGGNTYRLFFGTSGGLRRRMGAEYPIPIAED